jgi:hypothetical protein
MKKDLEELTAKMQRLLSEIPDNFVLENARLYIKRAINEVQNVKIKRHKRQQVQDSQNQTLSYEAAKNAVSKIDQLIEIERKNLSNKKPETNQNDGFLLD